jgi:uncharacterized membrane protein
VNLTQHLHPAVVHFPIVLLLVSSACGLLYLYWRQQAELRLGTWWAMGLGWIATAVAVLSGLVAQVDVPVDAPYRRELNLHVGAGLALLVVYGVLLYLRWLHARPRKKARGVTVAPGDLLDDRSRRLMVSALLIVGGLLVVITGFFGGELVFTWGVNVQ